MNIFLLIGLFNMFLIIIVFVLCWWFWWVDVLWDWLLLLCLLWWCVWFFCVWWCLWNLWCVSYVIFGGLCWFWFLVFGLCFLWDVDIVIDVVFFMFWLLFLIGWWGVVGKMWDGGFLFEWCVFKGGDVVSFCLFVLWKFFLVFGFFIGCIKNVLFFFYVRKEIYWFLSLCG